MQEYNIQWEYIPGNKNVIADVLSRINLDTQTFEGQKEKIITVYNILKSRSGLETLLENIRIHQQSDSKLVDIKERLEEQNDIITRFYCIHDGILFIKNTLNQENWKVIIPKTIERELVLDYHIRYGPMGALKVIKALEENCYIKDIDRKLEVVLNHVTFANW